MQKNSGEQHAWEEYRQRELRRGAALLKELGFALDAAQVHTEGERYLMSGKKLVLTGVRIRDGKRVVIKISSEQEGIREIKKEREARETLRTLKFAYRTFRSPEEILYVHCGGYVIFVTVYISQDKNFLDRPLAEQFNLALGAFKAQEGVHATTYSHAAVIRKIFGMWDARNYLNSFAEFRASARAHDPGNHELSSVLEKGETFLKEHRETLEQYCGFLTHTDFVPHNVRIVGREVYLLDHSSLRFGNKYESWARFLNFMLLYNRPLELALAKYVLLNRTPEEFESLRLMRVYKIGQLLRYYASTLSKTAGDLHALNRERILFWSRVLQSIIDDTPLSDDVIRNYQQTRDKLRSEEEKNRQKELH